MTAPTIDTTTTRPPISPCPAWCTVEHEPKHGSHAVRMHHHIGEVITTPVGPVQVSIAQHEAWHTPDTEWTQQAPTVALILPGVNLLVIDLADHMAIRLCGLISYDLYQAIVAAHALAGGWAGPPVAEATEPSVRVREALAIAKQVNA